MCTFKIIYIYFLITYLLKFTTLHDTIVMWDKKNNVNKKKNIIKVLYFNSFRCSRTVLSDWSLSLLNNIVYSSNFNLLLCSSGQKDFKEGGVSISDQIYYLWNIELYELYISSTLIIILVCRSHVHLLFYNPKGWSSKDKTFRMGKERFWLNWVYVSISCPICH